MNPSLPTLPLLQAFEWIAENAQYPAIMSMSVAGEMSVTVNEAARRLVEDRHIVMVGMGGWLAGLKWIVDSWLAVL